MSGCGGPLAPGPLAVPVSGHWEGTIDSPSDGHGTIDLVLGQTGQNISGSVRLSQSGISDVAELHRDARRRLLDDNDGLHRQLRIW